MFSGSATRVTVRVLDWLADRMLPPSTTPEHLRVLLLAPPGVRRVARNDRFPHCRAEIDLIAWDGEVLCFIEVKTRTSHAVKPAEAAMDHEKRREVIATAREYMQGLPPSGNGASM
jgi:putative endonuclease